MNEIWFSIFPPTVFVIIISAKKIIIIKILGLFAKCVLNTSYSIISDEELW